MFCPKCATQNLDGASFCRTCGANISLVPQALTGQMVQPRQEDEVMEDCGMSRRRRRREASIESAFKNIFLGVAFLIIAMALSETSGARWWVWMLIPAFSLMAKGVAQFVRVKERQKQTALGTPRVNAPPITAPPATAPSFPRTTDELRPPAPSVTEGTTRHLGVEAQTRHLETQERK